MLQQLAFFTPKFLATQLAPGWLLQQQLLIHYLQHLLRLVPVTIVCDVPQR